MKSPFLSYMGLGATLMLTACGTSVPNDAEHLNALPDIYPDYANVTIPNNIAPLNFKIKNQGEGYVTRVRTRGGDGFAVSGQTVDMPVAKWHSLLAQIGGGQRFC